jgi:segregation and condensation protein A
MSTPLSLIQQFKLDDFEGPLDLLLFLVRKNEINIYDIPIASITEQYLQFLSLCTELDLETVTEFYQMAATLLYIKSRTLLPTPIGDDEEWEDPRRELIEKLLDYQKYKKLAELMSEDLPSTEWVLERKKKQAILPFDHDDEFWEKIEVWDLFQTFSHIMKGLSQERIIDLYEETSINEKMTLIYEILEEKSSFLFTDLVIHPESLMEIVCAFLAVLELVKVRKIVLFQSRLYGDIQIRSRSE